MARRYWRQGRERRGYLINRQGGNCAIDNMRYGRERRERERDPDEDEEVYDDTKCIVLNSRDLQPNAFPLYKVQTPVVYRSQVSFSVAPSLAITPILAALAMGVSLTLIRLRHICQCGCRPSPGLWRH